MDSLPSNVSVEENEDEGYAEVVVATTRALLWVTEMIGAIYRRRPQRT